MPDETSNVVAGVTPEITTSPATGMVPSQQAAPAPAPTETVDDKARLEALERQLKNKAEEAARLHKKLQEKEQSELSETERLKVQLAQAEAEAKTLRLEGMKRQAADKFSLPPVFAARLQGETLEELEADAEALAKLLPKAAPPKVAPTNPSGGVTGETDDQRRARIYGQGGSMFDRDRNRSQGGGVVITTQE